MAQLLIYSLRLNGGKFEETPITIVSNGEAPPEPQIEIFKSFGETEVKTMPRIGGTPHANKFNAFYAVDESYDYLIYIDCDTVVMNDLDGILKNVGINQSGFKAMPIGGKNVRYYENLIQKFSLPSNNRKLEEMKDKRFPNNYPLFNTGVMVLTMDTVKNIRHDALVISNKLYERHLRNNALPAIVPNSLRGGILSAGWERLLWYTHLGSDYPKWMTEQLGIGLAVLKNDIEYRVLDQHFNWTKPKPASETEFPAIYHYMSGLHNINRNELFTGEWIDRYESDESPLKNKLAQLVQAYSNSHSDTF